MYSKIHSLIYRYLARVIEREKYYFRGHTYWKLPLQIDKYNV